MGQAGAQVVLRERHIGIAGWGWQNGQATHSPGRKARPPTLPPNRPHLHVHCRSIRLERRCPCLAAPATAGRRAARGRRSRSQGGGRGRPPVQQAMLLAGTHEVAARRRRVHTRRHDRTLRCCQLRSQLVAQPKQPLARLVIRAGAAGGR